MASHSPSTLRIPLAIVLAALVALAAGSARPAQAATFIVNSTADATDATPGDGACDDGAGNCTLRAAIQEANAAPAGPDTITVPAGTYTLTIAAGSDLDISDDLTINGEGAATTIIDGNGSVTGDRVLHISTNVTMEISGVTIQNGASPGDGGGILTDSNRSLTLTNVAVSGNSASGDAGGVNNNSSGDLTITNSTISGNIAGVDGGGIGSKGSGDLTITNSTISGNMATRGGGINNDGPGTVTVTDSTVSGNTATSSLGGGGIHNNGSGTFNITRTAIFGNSALDGGGINNDSSGTINVTNSTISENTSTGSSRGGGIYNNSSGSINVTNSTIVGNSGLDGGGINNDGSGDVTLKNTIVANSTSGGDCSGSVTSAGHNLIEDTTGCTIAGDTTGNIIGSDPVLGPLADNGGPTQTHALPAGSPAIDAGSGDCPPPATDQRGSGFARSIDGDEDGTAVCDIGAYEFEPPPATPTPTPTPTATLTPTPTPTTTPTGPQFPDTGGQPPLNDSGEARAVLLAAAIGLMLTGVTVALRRRRGQT